MRGNSVMGLALFLSAACGPSAGPDPFTPVVTVSAATENGATPMFVVAPDGRELLSWVSAADGGTDGVLHFQVRAADMHAVEHAVLRDSLGGIEPHGESPPQLAAAPDGSLYVAYTVGKDVGGRFPASALRFSRSEDGGRSWSDPISVNEGAAFGSHAFHALLAGQQGEVYVAWLSSTEAGSGVWIRSSTDGGREWGPARAVHLDPTCPCCRTGLALAPDGTLYLSFRKIFDGDIRDVVVVASHDRGESWSEPVRPRVDGWVFPGCPHAGPALRVDSANTVHIAWWTGKEGAAGVWYARSEDGGATWLSQPIDTAGRSAPSHVQLQLLADKGVVVAWDGGLGERPSIKLRASNDGGGSFGPIADVSDNVAAATFPVLGVAGDSLVVAWSQVSDSAYRAQLALRPDMSVPGARMGLPRVGQQEVLSRQAALTDLLPPP